MRPGPALPPRPAIVASVRVVVPLLLAALLIGQLAGPAAAAGLALGASAAADQAVLAVGWRTRACSLVMVVAAAALGVLSAGQPLVATGLVGLAAASHGMLVQQSAGLGAMLPVLVAIGASVGYDAGPVTVAGGAALGALLVTALAWALGVAMPPTPLPRPAAIRYAVILTVTLALATAVTLALDVDHGYWVVLTIAVVGHPDPDRTRSAAVIRTGGTLVGVAVAIAAVLLLPTVVLLVAALVCMALTVAWAAVGDEHRKVVYLTAAVLLVGSSGLAGTQVTLALDRLLLTAVGAGIAVVVTDLLGRRSPDHPDRRVDRPHRPRDAG